MTEATLTWSIWQALLQSFAASFTRRGFRRFAERITARGKVGVSMSFFRGRPLGSGSR